MCCCRQARKLQEMFQKVQQENEMLRNGRRPGTQAPLAGSGPQYNSLLSPPHNLRHQSNIPGSGRVVCPSSVHMHCTTASRCDHPSVLRCAVLCCAVPCCAVLCRAEPCRAVLCCAVLCYAVLCCAVAQHGHGPEFATHMSCTLGAGCLARVRKSSVRPAGNCDKPICSWHHYT